MVDRYGALRVDVASPFYSFEVVGVWLEVSASLTDFSYTYLFFIKLKRVSVFNLVTRELYEYNIGRQV